MESLFGQRLRQQRKANGWTLEQFAEKLREAVGKLLASPEGKK